jgi:hypothetical protein
LLQNRAAQAILPVPANLPMLCHNATLWWVFNDEFNRPIGSALDFATAFPNPTSVIDQMVPFGAQLTRPLIGSTTFTPGSVIVFVNNHSAVHSCIAIGTTQIGGYNQPNWFGGMPLGVFNTYTQHTTANFKWRGAMNPRDIRGDTGHPLCTLFQVPERAAKAVVRANVPVGV